MDASAPDAVLLHHASGSDGEPITPPLDASSDYAALLATCARKSTGANPVVAALTRAALDWLTRADVRQLRSALLAVVAGLD